MAARGRPPSAKTLVDRQLGRHPNPNRNIPMQSMGDGFVVPNHSGDHSEGRVDSAPVDDFDIVNKKYVDDNLFNVNIVLVLDGAVLTLNGNVLILQ